MIMLMLPRLVMKYYMTRKTGYKISRIYRVKDGTSPHLQVMFELWKPLASRAQESVVHNSGVQFYNCTSKFFTAFRSNHMLNSSIFIYKAELGMSTYHLTEFNMNPAVAKELF